MAEITGEPTADLIKEELEAERDWRRSLEQRALSLFASCGVIGGLSGIAARGHWLPVGAQWCLGTALVSFAFAAIGGLAVAFPVLAPSVKAEQLGEALGEEPWAAPADAHLVRASIARVGMIKHTRRLNDRKAIVLRWATCVSAIGICLLLAAVVIVLVR